MIAALSDTAWHKHNHNMSWGTKRVVFNDLY